MIYNGITQLFLFLLLIRCLRMLEGVWSRICTAQIRGGWLLSNIWASSISIGCLVLGSSSIHFGRWLPLDIVSTHLLSALSPVLNLSEFDSADGRPLPRQICAIDMPDDFFRIRLVCVLLDTCGMCFDHGTQKKKLDNFLTFFQVVSLYPFDLLCCETCIWQYYVHCKEDLPMDVDFMLSDSLEVNISLFSNICLVMSWLFAAC